MEELTTNYILNTTQTTSTSSSPNSIIWTLFIFCIDIFNAYIVAVCLIFGFFGNFISIIIFIRTRSRDKASAGYLGPLACFDFWNACTGVYAWSIQGADEFTNGAIKIESYATSTVGCFLAWFFIIYGMFLSGWTIVLFSSERALVVWFPLQMQAFLTPTKRRNVIITLISCAPLFGICAVTSPGNWSFGELREETAAEGCPPTAGTPDYLVAFFWIATVGLAAAIPCVFVLFLNIVILLGVRSQNRQMTKITSQKTEQAIRNEKRCLKNLTLVSIFYLVTMSPYALFWSWSQATRVGHSLAIEMAFYAINWASMNYCVNPLLYSIALPYYRDELFKIFTCGLRKPSNVKKT